MRIQPDTWLTQVLAQPVFSIHDVGSEAEAVVAHASTIRRGFYFAKLEATDHSGLRALTAAGFNVVEASLTFARTPDDVGPVASSAPIVRPFETRWAEAVLTIAETAFRYSRFHVDPQVGAAAANRVKREWIQSYIDGRRGDRLLISLDGDRPTGFVALLFVTRGDRRVGVIDLIGVDSEQQGRGVGRHLVAAALAACRGRADVLEVGTQSANVPSVRLYEAMHFRLVRSGFTLHLHTAA